MALRIEELQVLISANANQFKGELQSIRGEIAKLGNQAQAVSSTVQGGFFTSFLKANIATSLFLTTLGGLSRGFQNLVGEVITSGSALSRLRVANQAVTANLGITSEQLQKLKDDLADANTFGIAAENIISTLALSGMVKLAESLEYVDARTGETEKGVTALTLAIKDLSAARGIDSDLGIERVSKFIQRGEASFADGIIELSNLNDEYRQFARERGKELTELSAQEKAQARLNVVMREGAKSFGAYAATYNSSGKIISSVGMLIKSIIADIGASIEPILRVGSLAFLEFFRGIQQAVIGSAGDIRNWANRVAGYMVAIIRVIGRLLQFLPLVGAGFSRLANFTLKPIQAQGKMQQSLSGTGKAMDNTGKKAESLKKKLGDLASFDELNVINQPTDSGGGGAGGIGGGIGSDGLFGGDLGGFEDSTEEILGFARQAEEVFKSIADTVMNFLKPGIDLVMGAWGFLNEIIQIFIGYLPAIQKALEPVTNALQGAFNAALKLVTDAVEFLWQNGLKELVNILKVGLPIAFNIVMGVVTQVIGILSQLAGAAIDAVVMAVQGLWEVFKVVFKSIQSVIEFVLINIVFPLFRELTRFIYEQVIPWFARMRDSITIVWNNIRAGATNTWNGIINAVKVAINWIRDNILPVVERVKNGVTDAFDGMRKGVTDSWNSVQDIIKRGINGIIGLVNRFIDSLNEGIRQFSNLATSIPGGQPITFRIGRIPRLAEGGVVSAPTLAFMGEDNKSEAVLPLERNTEWADIIAQKLKEAGGNVGQGVNLIIQLGEDKIFEKFIDYYNDKSVATNSVSLNI